MQHLQYIGPDNKEGQGQGGKGGMMQCTCQSEMLPTMSFYIEQDANNGMHMTAIKGSLTEGLSQLGFATS